MPAVNCPSCRTEVQSEMVICPSCGTRLALDSALEGGEQPSAAPAVVGNQSSSSPPASAATAQQPPNQQVAATPAQRFQQAMSGGTSDPSDVERELWQGGYSPKAMFGTWISTGLVSVVALVVGALYLRSGLWWGIMLAAIALVWSAEGLLLLYRRLNVHYRLTNQRLFHERGLLSRSIDRIEVIDMDDITSQQGVVERFLGVGTIKILSSDQSHPEFYLVGIENVRDIYDKLDASRREERIRRGLHIESV